MIKGIGRTSHKTGMPLILAIEPDRRQAQQLTGVVCKRLHADLLLAESAERALAELGDRVPHLVLTSALLSPNDEVLLGERLRALDSAASHVQTLTIPVLATSKPRKRARSGGMLSVLGLGKTEEDSAPEGCDPTVFAAQCAEYLERAVAEHAMNAAAENHDETIADTRHPIIEPLRDSVAAIDEAAEWRYEAAAPIAEPAAPIAEAMAPSAEPFEPMPAPGFEPMPPLSAEPFEPMPVLSAEPVEATTEVSAEPFERIDTSIDQATESSWRPLEPVQPVRERFATSMPIFIDAPAAAATVQEAIAHIEAFVARESLAAETIAKIEAAQLAEDQAEEPVHHPAGEQADSDVPDGLIDLDLSTLFEDGVDIGPAVESATKRDEFETFETDVYDINVTGEDPWADEPAIVMPAIKPHVVPRVAPTVTSEVTAREVVPPAQVRARKDAEVWIPPRLGVRQLWPVMDAVTLTPRSTVARESERASVSAHTPSTRSKNHPKPIQDEWGFFDPEQCGFAALLHKLDEILENDDQPA
jgi:hypothetical protein